MTIESIQVELQRRVDARYKIARPSDPENGLTVHADDGTLRRWLESFAVEFPADLFRQAVDEVLMANELVNAASVGARR